MARRQRFNTRKNPKNNEIVYYQQKQYEIVSESGDMLEIFGPFLAKNPLSKRETIHVHKDSVVRTADSVLSDEDNKQFCEDWGIKVE